MTETELLDGALSPTTERRRKLLATWIKVFIWLFMIFGAIAPIGLVLGVFGMTFDLSIYGLQTMYPLSILGLLIIALFAIKGAVSFGLWTEKDWAVKLAIFDAIIGIVICSFVMIVLPFFSENNGFSLNLRLELFFLIPYLITIKNIKKDWESKSEFV